MANAICMPALICYTNAKEKWIMSLTGILAGVIIGAIIGYGTNYIAVKMLFRPLRQVRIGVITVPLTPGIIPRRQGQLAHALGKAVGEQLFTKDDLKTMLVSDEIRDSVVRGLLESMKQSGAEEKGIRETVREFVPEYLYDQSKGRIEDSLVEMISRGILDVDFGGIILEEGKKAVGEKLSGSMIGMFLNDSVLASLAEPIGDYVEKYLRENADELVRPAVQDNIERIEGDTVADIMTAIDVSDGLLSSVLSQMYDKIMNGGLDTLLEHLDISRIVEHKVNMMHPEDIEELVLSVMKNELKMVVRLGALIGAVLGLWNGLF